MNRIRNTTLSMWYVLKIQDRIFGYIIKNVHELSTSVLIQGRTLSK